MASDATRARLMRAAIETAAAHIGRAFNDLHWATLAVELPPAQLRSRMTLAIAELDEAKRNLSVSVEEG